MNLISEDYLMHHGVKGMKWGVRKQIQARKRWKNTTNRTNSLRVEKEYRKKIKNLESSPIHTRNEKPYKENGKKSISEGEWFNKHDSVVKSGKKAVLTARLLDAGYSKKEAEAGARWMQERGWALSRSDDNWRYTDRYLGGK